MTSLGTGLGQGCSGVILILVITSFSEKWGNTGELHQQAGLHEEAHRACLQKALKRAKPLALRAKQRPEWREQLLLPLSSHTNAAIIQTISLWLACHGFLGRATQFGEVKQYRRLKGKSVDINIDGGNLISSTLFVCAVHFLSWEQYEIVSPSPASRYIYCLVLLSCAFTGYCLLLETLMQEPKRWKNRNQLLGLYLCSRDCVLLIWGEISFLNLQSEKMHYTTTDTINEIVISGNICFKKAFVGII